MSASHPDGVTLSELVDEGLPAAEAADVRQHLASCAECRTLVDDLQRVKAAATTLPPLQPRREAWTRVERALRANPAPRRTLPLAWLAAAAALLLAVLIGYKLADVRRQPAPAPNVTAEAADPASAQYVEAELRQAEDHYQKAFTKLQQSMNDGKGSLDAQTAATLEKNLAVVDQAISESRAALRAQPTSVPAQASLLESFKSKISLLEDTVALINEMRNGPSLKPKGT